MRVHDSSNLTLCSRSRCGAREAMTVGCKPTKVDHNMGAGGKLNDSILAKPVYLCARGSKFGPDFTYPGAYARCARGCKATLWPRAARAKGPGQGKPGRSPHSRTCLMLRPAMACAALLTQCGNAL